MLKQTTEIIQKLVPSFSELSQEECYSILNTKFDNKKFYQDFINEFKSTSKANASEEVSDSNYTQLDGIIDFVNQIAPKLSDNQLEELTKKMLNYEIDDMGPNDRFDLMRGNQLPKILMGYIWKVYPEHYERLKQHISETVWQNDMNGMNNYYTAILLPVHVYFDKDEKVFQDIEQGLDFATKMLAQNNILIAEVALNQVKENLQSITIDTLSQRCTTIQQTFAELTIKVNQQKQPSEQASSNDNHQPQENPFTSFFNKFKPLKKELNQKQEDDYTRALTTLKDMLETCIDEVTPQKVKMESEKVKNKAWAVVKQIEKLKIDGHESTITLTEVLNNTQSLIVGLNDFNKGKINPTKEITPEEYQAKALTVQGKPSTGSKILGGMMIALGAAVIALSIALAAAINVGAIVGAAAGIYIAAQGIGFFQRGKDQSGLSKAMSNLAKTQEEPWTLIEGDDEVQTDENQSSEDELHEPGTYSL